MRIKIKCSYKYSYTFLSPENKENKVEGSSDFKTSLKKIVGITNTIIAVNKLIYESFSNAERPIVKLNIKIKKIKIKDCDDDSYDTLYDD